MELEAFRWLLTDDGQALLASATAAVDEAEGDPVTAGDRLRRTTLHGAVDPARAAAAMTQAHLRHRAVAKFGAASERMYFTTEGLQQATRPRAAAHRAARMAAAAPGTVIDLTCGIGTDLMAFAGAGLTAAGVDRDPVTAAVAEANLAALDVPGAVRTARAEDVDVAAFGAAYADPTRRGPRGRVFDAHAWEPPWPFVVDLLVGRGPCGRAVVKAAPGVPHELLPPGVEAEWVSEQGDVLEAALWSPALSVARRRATVLGTSGLATLTDEDDPFAARERPVRPVGEVLYEPDGAAIRAGLVTAVAARVGGGLLDEHLAYLTGDSLRPTPFARAYRVLEHLPYREKALRSALRERGIGRLTIKKRGVDVQPDRLRKRLALRGDTEATLVLTRAAGHGVALLVEPV